METEIIIHEIEDFKDEHRGGYSDYYIGITKHIDQRLIENNENITEHLQKGEYTSGNPTYKAECTNRDEAIKIEQIFQNLGMLKLNKRSHGVEESKFIYCYKMTEDNKKSILLENSDDAKKIRKTIKDFRDFNESK
ncbi:MAG: hypothetical protein PHE33_06460 [Bacteroidales bacterium]|nr:hypothetical protein [Bacteroidales bacterium]